MESNVDELEVVPPDFLQGLGDAAICFGDTELLDQVMQACFNNGLKPEGIEAEGYAKAFAHLAEAAGTEETATN